jgi:membrane protease subunit HflK
MSSVLQIRAREAAGQAQLPAAGRRFTAKRALAGVVLLYLASGLYLVPPDRQAVVTRFGRVVDARVFPGIHYHLPYPIERIERLKVRETKRAVIGGEPTDETLGRTQPFQTQFLTGDQNVIQLRAVAQYSVNSPADYLYRAANVEALVQGAVETELARETARRGVDAVLTTDKVAVQEAVRERAQAVLDRYAVGVSLASVNIETAGPPPEVAEAFRDVAGARADAARIVNEAQGYANDLVPRARGEADQLREAAEAYRARKINEARGDAERFTKLAAEYHKAQEVTSQRLYLEAMEQILPRIKKLIVDRDVDLSIFRKAE